ncbi:MAG: fumarylacetoacetate hydrolase family protein, partial [Bacteroidetes bacterium]|nr:fumarylacetoacetate hydrolase family protein [Bacteroidota bacterium]
MKLVTYLQDGKEQLAFCINNNLYNTNFANPTLPATMKGLLDNWEQFIDLAKQTNENIISGKNNTPISGTLTTEKILAPVPHPTSCRDGYAFRQHVAAARRN